MGSVDMGSRQNQIEHTIIVQATSPKVCRSVLGVCHILKTQSYHDGRHVIVTRPDWFTIHVDLTTAATTLVYKLILLWTYLLLGGVVTGGNHLLKPTIGMSIWHDINDGSFQL
jgi:hypothetical protein